MTLLCAKRNKTSQNIERQLSDHIADINFIILRRYGAQSALGFIVPMLNFGLDFVCRIYHHDYLNNIKECVTP
jgi:hypothetical protein